MTEEMWYLSLGGIIALAFGFTVWNAERQRDARIMTMTCSQHYREYSVSRWAVEKRFETYWKYQITQPDTWLAQKQRDRLKASCMDHIEKSEEFFRFLELSNRVVVTETQASQQNKYLRVIGQMGMFGAAIDRSLPDPPIPLNIFKAR